jgi:simple sugar transport system substrate-binding protein
MTSGGTTSVKKIVTSILIAVVCIIVAVACGKKLAGNDSRDENSQEAETGAIVVGFSQLGAESDWRTANTDSMLKTFSRENGYNLILEDGQQQQTNQIMAIRTFIQQNVDYIVLAPVLETGWDTVLQEAKDAGIPVIIVDRMVQVEDDSLFTAWVGSDFEMEGRKVVEWLNQYTEANDISPKDLHIVNVQGTLKSTAQLGRTKALREGAARYGWNILAEDSGEFTQTRGKEVMEEFLREYPNLNVVYCENDNEAFGVIEAIEESGRTAGTNLAAGEIMVLSFDGVNESALQYVAEGKIACIAECNPQHGPRVQAIIQTLEAGETPAKYNYVEGTIYSSETSVSSVTIDGKTYKVTEP